MPAAIPAKKIAVAPVQKPTAAKKATTASKPTAANNICDTCKAIGLPILLARYAAVLWYSDSKGIADWAKHPNYERSPSQIEYLLRLLRMGYVYLYYPIQNGQPKKWECYMVTVSGHLVKQSSPDIISPPVAGVVCKKTAHDSTKLEYITIQNPEKYSEVYIAFSENNWTQAVRSNYEKNAKLRQKRMSLINPKSMSASKNVKIAYGTSASVSRINDIVEYGGYSMGSGSIFTTMPDEAGLAPKRISSDAGTIGDYKLFKKTVTNTLWQKRLNKAESTYKSMQAKLKNAQGDAYVLAIPDEVGAVKELSDMMRQPFVWLQKYHQELDLKIAAMKMITGLETSMTGRKDENSAAYYQAWQRYKKEFDYAAYVSFRTNYNRLTNFENRENIEPRTAYLVQRLKGDAFLTVLNDFNQDHVYDGVRFEYLMNYIFKGLDQTEAGSAQIAAWVNDLSPANIEKNLVWRTFAINQKKSFTILYAQLQKLKATKIAESIIAPLKAGAKLVDSVISISNLLDSSKSFIDIFKGINEARVNLKVDSIEKGGYTDHFIAAIARPLVSTFSSTGTNMGLSDMTLAGIVLCRSGASPFSINALLSTVRKNYPLLRPTTPQPFRFSDMSARTAPSSQSRRIFMDAVENLTRQNQARATLTEAYKDFNVSNIKTGVAPRITYLGAAVVILELINFNKLMGEAASKGDAKSFSQQFASGLAIIGGMAAIQVFRTDAIQEQTRISFAVLKASAGLLLGTAGFIGAFWDADSASEKFGKGYNGVAFAYIAKVTMGAANATGVAMTGFETSSKLLTDMAKKKVGQSIAVRGAAMLIGRTLLVAATWQFSLFVLALQMIIWNIDKDELQRWLAKTPFADNEFKDPVTMQSKLLEVIDGLNKE